MRFKDKIVIATGGGSGMGLAAAKLFASEGASLAVVDIKGDDARAAAKVIQDKGGSALAIEGDVSNRDFAWASVDEVLSRFGRVDILLNIAGIATIKPAVEYSEWEKILGVNLNAPFYWSQAAASRSMIPNKCGAIVNISSLAATVAYPNDVGYIASKAGVLGLTRSLAIEWVKHNIRVNCICPGFTDTQIIRDMEKIDPDRYAHRRQRVPMARAGRPEEMADAMAYLASDQSSYVTGTILYVDGGQLALSSGWAPA
jgi:NAD(P)-dependent dehydrogenase (short-subunit alcohol dehydrogenase family)